MEFPDVMTIGEKYGPAMEITDPDEAQAYWERCVTHCMRDGKTREEAEAVERSNLGYYAGYYGADTRARVERLFSCAHPVFGAIAEVGQPTPAEAFTLGKSLARRKALVAELQGELNDTRAERVEKLKGETAEWIDALQGTDADLAARLDALTGLVEQETADLDKGIVLLGRLSDIVEAWVNIGQAQQKREAILAHRVEKLEKWVDGTGLITSERFCALTERVAELETSPVLPRVPGGHGLQPDDVLQHEEWLHGGGAVEYDLPPKGACDITPDKSAACTCGAGDAIPQDHDEVCPKYDGSHIPF